MTIDLTKITTPFGLLDNETQEQLRAAHDAGMLLQLYLANGWDNPSRDYNFNRPYCVYRLAPGQVWPKPEPKRDVRYFHLWDDGFVSLNRDKLEGRHNGVSIIARARVEVVEGQFDD